MSSARLESVTRQSAGSHHAEGELQQLRSEVRPVGDHLRAHRRRAGARTAPCCPASASPAARRRSGLSSSRTRSGRRGACRRAKARSISVQLAFECPQVMRQPAWAPRGRRPRRRAARPHRSRSERRRDRSSARTLPASGSRRPSSPWQPSFSAREERSVEMDPGDARHRLALASSRSVRHAAIMSWICSGEPVVVVGKMVVVPCRACVAQTRQHGVWRAVHEVGAATAVDVDVDEAGCDERARRSRARRAASPPLPRPHGGDPPASAEHGPVLEHTVGQDDGAAKEHGAHTARLSQ